MASIGIDGESGIRTSSESPCNWQSADPPDKLQTSQRPVTTYLNVPFNEKAEAKAKGARWDSEARKWFVPVGRDLEPFLSWLPVDPSTLVSQDLTTSTKGVPLSTLLAGVATAVEQVFRQGVWTTAEVVRVHAQMRSHLARQRDHGVIELLGRQ